MKLLVAALSGLAAGLATPGPGLWPLVFLALASWAVVNDQAASPRQRFFVNYIWGVVFFGTSAFWLARVTPAAFIPVIVIAPLFIVFSGFVYRNLRRAAPAVVALPAAWVAGEVLRTIPPFYYPWNLAGYSLAPWLDFAGTAAIGGVFFTGFLVAAVGGALTDVHLVLQARDREGGRARAARFLAVAVVIVVVSAWGGSALREVPASLPVGPEFACVQPNIEQALKENPGSFEEYIRKVAAGIDDAGELGADIVVLPETMLPSPVVRKLDPGLRFDAKTTAADFNTTEKEDLLAIRRAIGPRAWFLTGAVIYDTPPSSDEYPQPRNSALFFDNTNRERARYDKLYLVPGGEMIPLLPEGAPARWLRKLLNPLTQGMSPDLLPGSDPGVFEFAGAGNRRTRFGVAICYDNVFSFPFCGATRGGAEFHVVLSNEGWFPDSYEMDAMLAYSRFRAIETRRSVLRATNTGVSCLVGPDGSMDDVFRVNGRQSEVGGVFVARPRIATGATIFVTIGELPAYGAAVLATLAAFVLSRRAKAPG